MSRNFNPDELYLLAREMDLPTLLKFCSTSNKVNNLICRSDKIWQDKLLRDFPDYSRLLGSATMSLKTIYIKLYQLTQLKEKLNIKQDIYDLYLERRLSFKNKKVTEIPYEIGVLTYLEYLDLDKNLITSVPKEIGNLMNLRVLWLNSNSITELPESIGNLVSLKNLYLNNNKLKTLPLSIRNLNSLKVLNLYNNQLTKIPIEIATLPKLESINLLGNLLTEIPIDFATIKRKRSLEIRFNNNIKYPMEWQNIPGIKISSLGASMEIIIPANTPIWWSGVKNIAL